MLQFVLQGGLQHVPLTIAHYLSQTAHGVRRAHLILAKTPTKFITDSMSIGQELKRKCDGTHAHQPLIDGRAKDAARYPPGRCTALCRGITKEKMQRHHGMIVVLDKTRMSLQEGDRLG